MDAACLFAAAFARNRFEDLSPAVVDITKNQILDLMGVAVAGIGEPGAKQVVDLASNWGGRAESSVIGSKMKLPAPNAAQANATMAHARDYDDVHETAVMHPGIVAITSALAVAESVGGISGREFITAVALGSDMICRLGLASRPGVSAIHTGWHYTTLYGYPTAALTAARVLGLSEEQMNHAFGIAYHQCSGNGQAVTDGALTKRLGPGFAVKGGIIAALMAAGGVTGARNSLEGEQGLFKLYHQGQYDRDLLVGDLGRRFEGLNVTLKPYPCCRGVHASIDAALAIVGRHSIDPVEVEEIVLTTGEANHRLLCTPLENKVRPRNPVDSQFSIPWGVATALLKKRVVMEDYSPAAVADPEMLGLAAKIRTAVDPALNSSRGVEPARLKVSMRNGQVYSAQVDSARGSPTRPMTFDDCTRKFRDCVALADIPEAKATEAIQLVAGLERAADACDLIRIFV